MFILLEHQGGVRLKRQYELGKICRLCAELPKWYLDEPPMSRTADIEATWAIRERTAYALGTLIRASRVAPNPVLVRRVAELCQAQALGRGRQSWVLVLEKYGRHAGSDVFGALLNDADVVGQAAHAARVLVLQGVTSQMRPLLQHPQQWIRQEATKYFAKVEKKRASLG